ncbi:hypothetical protein Dimus_009580 [Dionaea muscipula]
MDAFRFLNLDAESESMHQWILQTWNRIDGRKGWVIKLDTRLCHATCKQVRLAFLMNVNTSNSQQVLEEMRGLELDQSQHFGSFNWKHLGRLHGQIVLLFCRRSSIKVSNLTSRFSSNM